MEKLLDLSSGRRHWLQPQNDAWNQALQEDSGYSGSANYLETLLSLKLSPDERCPKAFQSKGKQDGSGAESDSAFCIFSINQV